MQIADQILGCFDADREPQQRVGDAGDAPRLRIHRRVSHARRMRDQALDAAERFGEREALQPVEERAHVGNAAVQLEAQHGAEAGLLAACQLVLRM